MPAGRSPLSPVGRQPQRKRVPGAGPLKNGRIGIAFREPAEPLSNGLSRLVVAALPQGKLGRPQPGPVLEVRRGQLERQIDLLPGGREVALPS